MDNVFDKNLFQGEYVAEIEGQPALYSFRKGDDDKPLIVCVPGARTSARLYYGVHKDHDPKDFLRHWLLKKGFSVLAISYPLEIRKPVFKRFYPSYSVMDWGQSIAALTEKVVKEHGLSNEFFLVGWSAGGKSVLPTSFFSLDKTIQLKGFIGLAATPPIPGLMTYFLESKMRESGYWHTALSFPRETKQIMDNFKNGGAGKIDTEVLLDYYLGHNPVSVLGVGLKYHKTKGFVKDVAADMADNMNYKYELYPLCASIGPTRIDDLRHSLTDASIWAAVFSQSIYNRYFESGKYAPEKLSEENWSRLKDFVHNTPKNLYRKVENGNHCFFIGKKGAKETAKYIEELVQNLRDAEKELLRILKA